MPPIIEWADIAGAASIAATTAHPIVILRSMTILPNCRELPLRHRENSMQNVQMTIDLISDKRARLHQSRYGDGHPRPTDLSWIAMAKWYR
jgi:hypothetical protein